MLAANPPGAQATLLRELDRELEAGKSIAEAFGRGDARITALERAIIGFWSDYYGMLEKLGE